MAASVVGTKRHGDRCEDAELGTAVQQRLPLAAEPLPAGLDGRRQGGLLERHARDAGALALGHRGADQQGTVPVAAHVEQDAREVLAAGEHGVGDVVGEDLRQDIGELGVRLVVAAQVAQRAGAVVADRR